MAEKLKGRRIKWQVPTRPCKKCSTAINGLDYAGDYCGSCSASLREELIDFVRASDMPEGAKVQQTLRIYRVKVWTESLHEELKAELSNWREDSEMSKTKTCPYGGEEYEAKYKNSPHCGADECVNAHKREISRRVREAKKRHNAQTVKQQVENIPSAKSSHPEEAITPPPVRRAPAPIQAEAVIEIGGQTIRIPLTIQLDIKVEVNASRD